MLRNAPPAAEGRDSWHPEIEAAESCVCLGRQNWSRVGLARFLAQAAACLRVSALAGAERALGSVAGALVAAARRARGGRSFMVRMTAWEGDARAAAGAPPATAKTTAGSHAHARKIAHLLLLAGTKLVSRRSCAPHGARGRSGFSARYGDGFLAGRDGCAAARPP